MKKKLTVVLVLTALALTATYVVYKTYLEDLLYTWGIERTVEELVGEVEKLRGLKYKRTPEINVVTRDWVLEQWGPSTSKSEISYWEDVYKLTLLVGEDYNFTRTVEVYTVSWIAASSGNTIYIVKENFILGRDTSLRATVHELTHVLQFQNFGVEIKGSNDEKMAIIALVEGDADYVANLYSEAHQLKAFRITELPLSDPPLALKYFPYVYGEPFVKSLYYAGGWDLVNKAYTKPPKSTEQIMHPEKYLEGEDPVEVEINIPQEYKVVHSDVLGEFYIYVLFAHRYGEDVAREVASGWAGDRVYLLYNSTHKVLIWKIVWDSSRDAEEFYKAYTRLISDHRGELLESKEGSETWKLGDLTISVSIKSNAVKIVSSRPI